MHAGEQQLAIKKRVTFRRLGVASVTILFLAGFGLFFNRAHSETQVVQTAPFDGVTIYRGIFFASGPVASRIPTIRTASRYFPAEYKNLESQMIRYIQTKDPNFFNRLAKELQSGDRNRVAAAIRNANAVHKEALLDVTRNSRTPFAGQVQQLRAQAEPQPSPDPQVITNLNSCVVLLSHIVLEINVLVGTKGAISELKGLTFERYVDEIVRGLPRARIESRAG